MQIVEFSFSIVGKDRYVRARAGVITTPHGQIKTPAFSPVATRATVRGLTPLELVSTNTQVVLGNAYHLYLQPGIDTIKIFGGIATFMKWNGPTITDSGGYQVSFLWNRTMNNKQRTESGTEGIVSKVHITDKGMYFRSHIDGSKHLLSPEASIEIQNVLGADIIMAMDQPMGFRFSKYENEEAYARTFAWEERSYKAWDRAKRKSAYGEYQALFGIIQGQLDRGKRQKCLKFILSMGFPGIAIGDETIGVNPKVTAASLDTVTDLLPDDKPLHALGLGGGPEGIFEAVERGVDLFDNSSITRLARTGLLFVHPEDGGKINNKFRIDIGKIKYKDDKNPISKTCKCSTCSSYSRAYLRHLLVSKEMLGARLSSIHNVYFINDLLRRIRISIIKGDFASLKKHWLGSSVI